MTVSVPANEKTGAALLQSKITTLAARTDYQSMQALNAAQIDLVNTLLDQRKLIASAIISTMPVNSPRNSLYAAITAQNTLIANYGNTPPFIAAQARLDQLQQQLVREEMASGARTAASILSTMSYIGGAAQ